MYIHVDLNAEPALLSETNDLIQIRIGENANEIRCLAAIAKRNRLYVAGWVMRSVYMDWIAMPGVIHDRDRLAIASHNSKPVGASFYTHNGDEVMVYVKPAHRRKGIGKSLVRMATKHVDIQYAYGYGTKGSDHFWTKLVDWNPSL